MNWILHCRVFVVVGGAQGWSPSVIMTMVMMLCHHIDDSHSGYMNHGIKLDPIANLLRAQSHNLDPIAHLLRAQAQQQMKTTRRRVEVANKVTEIIWNNIDYHTYDGNMTPWPKYEYTSLWQAVMLCVVVQRLLNRLHRSAWRGTQKSPEGTEVGNSKDDIVSEKKPSYLVSSD